MPSKYEIINFVNSEKYITAHADSINWGYVSHHMDISCFSDEFFHVFHEEIAWGTLSKNKSMTNEFAHKFEKYFGAKFWTKKGKYHRLDGPAITWKGSVSEKWYKEDELHRIDGPAVTWSDGTTEWYKEGKLHREDGPAMVDCIGVERWYKDGEYHRIGGPSLIFSNGHLSWHKDGKLHNDDGPSEVYEDGTLMWYKNGKLHRENGPAIMWANGSNSFYLEDKNLFSFEHRLKIVKSKTEKYLLKFYTKSKRIGFMGKMILKFFG